jgi:hypothetical protein
MHFGICTEMVSVEINDNIVINRFFNEANQLNRSNEQIDKKEIGNIFNYFNFVMNEKQIQNVVVIQKDDLLTVKLKKNQIILEARKGSFNL